ncbi:hypothetical protein SAMN04515695_0580 [Pseudovibrio sp. Tun.PSC04-5.I4]|nr:hypothetical protein SAMN04515695_0580 [Pseudovibrio sp. Tun.PSC04-5.I4]
MHLLITPGAQMKGCAYSSLDVLQLDQQFVRKRGDELTYQLR